MNIGENRYSITGNEIWASFMNYIILIKPFFLEDENNYPNLLYNVTFMQGNYDDSDTISISCSNLEEAFEKIEKYSKYIKFDEVIEKIRLDYVDSAVLKKFAEFE
jgi:hypothetical protein